MSGKLNKDLESARKQVERLVKDLEKITKKPAPTFDINNLNQANAAISTLESAITSANQKAEELEKGFGGISGAISAALAEMDKTNSATNRTIKAMRGIKSITEDLKHDQDELVTLNLKQLKSKQDKLATLSKEAKEQAAIVAKDHEKLALDKNGNKLYGAALKQRLKSQGITMREFESIQSIIAANEENLKVLDEANEKLGIRVAKEKKISDGLGVMGGVLKGISKIPILGDVVDADEAVKEMEDHLRGSGTALGAMGKGLKNLGGQMFKGLTNPANLAALAFGTIFSALKDIDKQTGDAAKKMNMTYNETLASKEELMGMAVASGDTALNSTNLLESQVAINQALGTSTKMTEEELKTFTKLRDQAGFTNDELTKLDKLSRTNGKTLEQNSAEILGAAKAFKINNKLALNEKEILKDVAGASASLTLSLGKSGPALAEAAAQARKFGITLQQAEKISESLLDFEGSIEKELSAELLTGKDLNLERARGLALQGKAGAAAADMLSQLGSAKEFGDMNVIAQKSIAEAMGMTREEAAQSLMQAEALKNTKFTELDAAKEEYDLLRQTMSEKDAAIALGSDELAQQFEQQSMQEKFNQSVMQLKEIFVNQIFPALQPILNAFNTLVSNATLLKGIISVLAGIFAGRMVAGITQSIIKMGVLLTTTTAQATAATAGATAMTLGAIIPVILGAVAAVGAAIMMFSDDMISKPGYGKRTLMGPEGTIALNDKDTVIAGTKLFGDDTVSEPGKNASRSAEGSVRANSGMASVSSAINNLGSNLSAIASRPINVGIDGQNVINATVDLKPNEQGNAVRKNSYRIQ